MPAVAHQILPALGGRPVAVSYRQYACRLRVRRSNAPHGQMSIIRQGVRVRVQHSDRATTVPAFGLALVAV